MHAVVNQLTLKRPLDDALLARFDAELRPEALADPTLRGYYLVRVSEEEAFMVVLYDTLEALEAGTRATGAPFFREHVGPYLAGPPRRVVGEVVARADRADMMDRDVDVP